MIGLRITGLDEIDKVLTGMPRQLTERVLQTAGIASAQPLIARAHFHAPVGKHGYVASSIGIQRSGFDRVNQVPGGIGVGPRRGRYKGYAAHLNEYGTRKRQTTRKANRGIMKPKPFMEPAYLETKEVMLGRYNQEVARVLVNFMKRTIKNA